MGTAEAEGDERVKKAIMLALSSPLLESNDISGAQRILLSIAYSPKNKIKLSDQTTVTEYINERIQIKAKLFKHGFAVDENLGDKVRVTIVAAGFDLAEPEPEPKTIPIGKDRAIKHVIEEVENELNSILNLEPVTPVTPKINKEEQIRNMINKFMREGYRNPMLTSTPTYERNGIVLKDPRQIRQQGKVSEHSLNQLLTFLQA